MNTVGVTAIGAESSLIHLATLTEQDINEHSQCDSE